MCRYAFTTYKSHYVCFNCRKTFKQYPAEDLIIRDGLWEQYRRAYLEPNRHKAEAYRAEHPELVEQLKTKYFNRKYPCPQCSKSMANVGMDFKAPKMNAVKEWEIVRGMYKLGHAFQTCGCDGPGFIPTSEPEYADYLLKRKNLYQDMLNSRTGKQTPDELEQYINYWNGKLEAIDQELGKITTANRR